MRDMTAVQISQANGGMVPWKERRCNIHTAVLYTSERAWICGDVEEQLVWRNGVTSLKLLDLLFGLLAPGLHGAEQHPRLLNSCLRRGLVGTRVRAHAS
jgi:hypothetical protein